MVDRGRGRSRRVGRAHLVWLVGLLAYICAVAARTSFGVASTEAATRFAVSGAALSMFGVVQLGTYAAAQIPGGLLLDRIGPRRMLVIAAVTMGMGQLMLAFSSTVGLALAARLLTGIGDAATLISVVRLIITWFPSSQVPVFTQLTAMIGQFGQVVAAVPFLATLVHLGWEPAFASLAALIVVVLLLVLAVVRDEPELGVLPAAGGPDELTGPVLARVLRSPGTWAGFFSHALTLVTVNTFLMLWGVPFLTEGHGQGPARVSLLLTLNFVVMGVAGPLIGLLTGRYPRHRVRMVWAACAVLALAWVWVLVQPEPLGTLQLLPLIVALGLGSATCAVGFDLARTDVPRRAAGTATGMVNVGGYTASLVAVLIIGLVLDLRTAGAPPTLLDYRVAHAAQIIVVIPLVVGLILSDRWMRRLVVPPGS